MSFDELESRIVRKGLCTSCGACRVACPNDLIRFGEDLIPHLADGVTSAACESCMDCLRACPGEDPETPESEFELFGRTRSIDERWLGVFAQAYAGCATDASVFRRSASGGSATTLLQAAMACLRLDCVVVAGRESSRSWRAQPALCVDPAEIANFAQSTYQLSAHLAILKELLVSQPTWRIGLVGLACHVQAVRKLQRMDTEWGRRVRDQVVFILEIGCSSSTMPSGTETLITDVMGLSLAEIAEVRYREGEYPGQIVARTTRGEQHSVPFWQAVQHFKDHKSHRCLTCGDWMSGLADVSCCDGDPNIFKASLEVGSEFTKHGRILVRTATGARVLDWAIQTGALRVWHTDLAGLNLGLERKRNRRAHYETLDVPIPIGPIPGYSEQIDVVPDDKLISVPKSNAGSSTQESLARACLDGDVDRFACAGQPSISPLAANLTPATIPSTTTG